MKKYLLTVLILLLIPLWSMSQSRGVGVTPAEINLQGDPPLSFILTVKNFSSDKEWVEVTFSPQLSSLSSADPGRFSLSGGASREVLLVFDGVKKGGSVRISASRFSAEGVSTGTGVEVPVFYEEKSGSVAEEGIFAYMGRASMISSLSGGSYFFLTVVLLLFLILFFRFSGMLESRRRVSLFLLFCAIFIVGSGFGAFFFKRESAVYVSESGVRAVAPLEISVNLVIDYGEGDLQHFTNEIMWEGGTVFDLLTSMEKRYGVSVETRNFPGVGVFIEGIHGVRNTRSSYWQYWVNEEYAQKGADSYILEDGDTVLWKRM